MSLSSKNNLRLSTGPCLPRGSITMESLECGKNFKKAEPKGKYCCVCKNYGGKIVDGEKVSLHRFPANEKENLVWRKRVQFVMVPGFKITKFSRLCSHHFVGKKGPQKPRITLPTLFAKKDFKTTAVIKFLSYDVALNVCPDKCYS